MSGKLYRIEEILKERCRKGQVECFVKWKGYSSKSNSWVLKSWVEDLPRKKRETKKTNTKRVRQSTTNRVFKAKPLATQTSSAKLALIASATQASSQTGSSRKSTKRITEPDSVARTTAMTAAKESSKADSRSNNSAPFYEIERIWAKRIVNSKVEYLVHWKGYSRDESSWEPENRLKSDYCKMYCYSLRTAFMD